MLDRFDILLTPLNNGPVRFVDSGLENGICPPLRKWLILGALNSTTGFLFLKEDFESALDRSEDLEELRELASLPRNGNFIFEFDSLMLGVLMDFDERAERGVVERLR